jgi:hypothetical protein
LEARQVSGYVNSSARRSGNGVNSSRHGLDGPLGLDASKHVYVEKPFALTIREGRAMVAAAERTQRILFPGTQHRSAPHIAEAARSRGRRAEIEVPVEARRGIAIRDFLLNVRGDIRFNKMRFLVNYRYFPIMPAAISPISEITASIASTRSWASAARTPSRL